VSDTQTMLRLQMLERDSRVMAWAYYDEPTDQFMFLLETDYGTPAFDAGRQDAAKKGAKLVAVVAWMNDTGPDGEALFEYEVTPGGNEEIAQRARDLFRKNVVEAGLEAGVLTMETGHS
jgi:hypothetical protein